MLLALKRNTTYNMVFQRMLSFLYLLVVIVISHTTAKPDYNYTFCFTGADYAPNSTYHSNLKTLLLSRLTSNTKIDYGFYNSSYGDDYDNEVYATGLCRGDVTSDTCRSCLNDSGLHLINKCSHQKEGVGGSDKCILHYSDRSIFGYSSFEYAFLIYYVSSEINVTNWDEYNYVLTNLLSRLKVKAATGDADPNRKFAAGKAKVEGHSHQTIYAVVQCSPDISEVECNDCLTGGFSDTQKYCFNKSGGAIIKFSCNIRYQNSSFYEPIADELILQLQFSPPALPPSPFIVTNSSSTTHHGYNHTSQTVITKVVPAVTIVVLLFFVASIS